MKSQFLEDIEQIITIMQEEEIDLKEWKLIDIPYERVYSFYNEKRKEAFDFEEDEKGKLLPHYYNAKKGSKTTKFSVSTIKEAISKYKI